METIDFTLDAVAEHPSTAPTPHLNHDRCQDAGQVQVQSASASRNCVTFYYTAPGMQKENKKRQQTITNNNKS